MAACRARQQRERMRSVGVLTPFAAHDTEGQNRVTAFAQALQQSGWSVVNPLIALLAQQTQCPIHGLRVVRLPDGNSFHSEITDPIETPRHADGRIDIKGTMQAITTVVEAWVREYSEQWLWLHRKWR
jgi:lauroyl/myristoyl acyltransferase